MHLHLSLIDSNLYKKKKSHVNNLKGKRKHEKKLEIKIVELYIWCEAIRSIESKWCNV
jgi:hypothetical protein